MLLSLVVQNYHVYKSLEILAARKMGKQSEDRENTQIQKEKLYTKPSYFKALGGVVKKPYSL